MATRPPAPDYSGRDYASAKTRLQRLVNSIFPAWTDFNKANFGNVLLSCMAFIVDVISKYTDFMGTESLPEHATLRRSVQAHSKWIGYTLSGRKAAQANPFLFGLSSGVHSSDILIPAGTLVRSPDSVNPIEFQLLSTITLLAGTLTIPGIVEHSENAQDEETSTGSPGQIFRLTQDPFIEDTLTIVATDGIYTKVDNFLDSGTTDQHFTVETDDDERAVVRFGDGVTGKIPEGLITFDYKVGGGVIGNVDLGVIMELVDPLVDVLSNPVTVDVVNPFAASGGADPETLEHAKQQAPAELRVLNRTIAREDFSIGAMDVATVTTAVSLTSDQTILIREGEIVTWVLIQGDALSNGSFKVDVPGTALLRTIEEYWRSTKPKGHGIYARAVGDSGGSIKVVNILVTLHLEESADTTVPTAGQPTNIGLAIFTALDEWFAVTAADGSLNGNVDWGFNVKKGDGTSVSELAWGDVYDLINGVSGVRKIDCGSLFLNTVADDVPLRLWELPQIGTVTIINADDSAQLYPAV